MSTDRPLSESSAASGRVLLLIAALLWSTSGLIIKCGPMQDIPQEHRGPLVACYRVLFTAAAAAPFVKWMQIQYRPALAGMALSFALMNVMYVTAVTRTTAAAAIFLQYTSTAWAYLLGLLLLRERPDRGSGFAVVCALAGIAWIVAAEWHGEHLAGNLIALGSGLSYSGVIIGMRMLRSEQAAWLVFLNSLVGGLFLLPWVSTFPVELTWTQWSIIAGLGVFQMGVPYLLFAIAVRTVPAGEAALITLIEAVLNPIWVWLFLGEVAPLSTWIGGALILFGLVARYTLFADPRAIAAPRIE